MLPTALIGIVAYAVSEMSDEVFGMAITTILQCFVVDEEMFEVVITLNKSPIFLFTDEQLGTFFFRRCLL